MQDDTGDPGDTRAAEFFEALWDELADILGVPTTAALVQRSALRATQSFGRPIQLVVTREQLDHRYTLPETWQQPGEAALAEFKVLVAELALLLREMTGDIVISRLMQAPRLHRAGLGFLDARRKP